MVDIGAGAATVAVALGEAIEHAKHEQVDYLGFDPNPAMRKLGKRVLKHLDAGFRSAKYIQSLEEVDFTDTDRLLLTFSYVAHQDAVTQDDIDEWASLIKRAVYEVDRDVELIYTTIYNAESARKGALPDLKRKLQQANFVRNHKTVRVRVRRRFPGSVSSNGQICWEEQSEQWSVQAEHWILGT